MRNFFAVLFAVFAILIFSPRSYAEEFDYGRDALESALPDDAREYLESEGITPETTTAFSFSDALGKGFELLKSKASKPLKTLCALCGVVLFCALTQSLEHSGSLKGVFSAVGVLCGAGIAAAAMYDLLNSGTFYADFYSRTYGYLGGDGSHADRRCGKLCGYWRNSTVFAACR